MHTIYSDEGKASLAFIEWSKRNSKNLLVAERDKNNKTFIAIAKINIKGVLIKDIQKHIPLDYDKFLSILSTSKLW